MSKASAAQIGSLRHLVVDVDDQRIAALHIGGKGGRIVSWSDVESFGDDAVIVADEAKVRAAVDEREQRAAKGDLVMLDKRVLSDRGNECGHVGDVSFDAGTGRLESLAIGDGWVDADRLVGIGTYAVVIAAREGDEIPGL